MIKLSEDAEKIMAERFGKDTIIALATVENEIPFVRYVNAYYKNTIILCVELTDGLLLSHGTRYEF